MGMPNAEGREGRDVGTPMQRVQQVRAEGTSSCKCVRSASVECNDRWTKPRDSDEFVFRMPNVELSGMQRRDKAAEAGEISRRCISA